MQHVQPPTDAIRVSARSVGLGRLDWSEDRVNELAALLKGGLSFGLAAEKLGVTRNACLGQAHRRRQASDARFALHRAPVRTKPTGAGAEVRKRKAAAMPTPRPTKCGCAGCRCSARRRARRSVCRRHRWVSP